MPQEMTFGEALLAAIDEVAEQDPRIVLFNPSFAGEAGHEKLAALRKKYATRIKYPPIAEIGFCGIAIGAAMAGLRPLVDISTATFSYEAIPFDRTFWRPLSRHPCMRTPGGGRRRGGG